MAPPLDPHATLTLLLQLGGLLACALLLGALARRVGVPAVVGELAAGVLLGPSLLDWGGSSPATWYRPAGAGQMQLVDAVGQVSLLLVVAAAGTHLDLGFVRRRATSVVAVSVGAFVVPLLLGVAVALLSSALLSPATLIGPAASRWTFAVFVGVALSVSAIPVIAKTLADLRLLDRDIGQFTLAAASVEDAAGWWLLSVLAAVLAGARSPAGWLALLVAPVLFVIVVLFVVAPLIRWVARLRLDAGVVSAVFVAVVLLGAAASQALGLEGAFGAFVIGAVVGSPKVIEPSLLAPLRTVALGVFAPMFLATAGLRVDLGVLAHPRVLAAGALLLGAAVVGKLLGGYLGARIGRLGHWEGLALGSALNARGVIEIVVATVGLRLGILTEAAYGIVVALALITSIVAAPMLRWSAARIATAASPRPSGVGGGATAPDP